MEMEIRMEMEMKNNGRSVLEMEMIIYCPGNTQV